jgi:DNA-directed RNA polymerase subunit RPC12/RpoP
MPIRFRCVSCDKLMGISRRKAGSRVRCPACASEVVVPNEAGDPPTAPASQPPLFERSEFRNLFEFPAWNKLESNKAAPADVAPPNGDAAGQSESSAVASKFEPNRPSPGAMLVTRGQLLRVYVLLAFALAVAFAFGVIVGRTW